jgi:hypothetical protein
MIDQGPLYTSRATSAMADAIDEGVGVIKHAVKRSGDAAEELMHDTTQRVKRHPTATGLEPKSSIKETTRRSLALQQLSWLISAPLRRWNLC